VSLQSRHYPGFLEYGSHKHLFRGSVVSLHPSLVRHKRLTPHYQIKKNQTTQLVFSHQSKKNQTIHLHLLFFFFRENWYRSACSHDRPHTLPPSKNPVTLMETAHVRWIPERTDRSRGTMVDRTLRPLFIPLHHPHPFHHRHFHRLPQQRLLLFLLPFLRNRPWHATPDRPQPLAVRCANTY